MEINSFSLRRTLPLLIGLGLSAPLQALEPGGVTGPALDRIDQQVERAAERRIQSQLEQRMEREVSRNLSSKPKALPALPDRLSIQSETGQEAFADVAVENGWRAVERQWLVTLDTGAQHHLNQPGITVLDQTRLQELDLTVLRFRVTEALDSREALRDVLPETLVQRLDRNHIYAPEAESDARPGQSGLPRLQHCDAPVTVGMVDTAINIDHPAFSDLEIVQRDFLDDLDLAPGFQAPTDHGTAVASRLIGKTAEDEAHRLPSATLVNASVFYGRESIGSGATLMHLVRGLNWLVARDVGLINISMAGPDNRLLADVIQRITRTGMPVVAAVGNAGPATPPLFPAAYPEVIGVTAVDRHHRVYRWANQGDQVDIAALGVNVPVALGDDGYGTQSGTSLATPVVSAYLACALTTSTAASAGSALTDLALDLGATGKDPVFGHGLLNPGG